MRWILFLLACATVALQSQLWLSDDGHRITRKLRMAAETQELQNQELQKRNQALEAEVSNLKRGHEAAEERARTDLGMVSPEETFFLVVPDSDSSDQ